MIDDGLQRGGDDGRAARRADGECRRAVLHHDGRALMLRGAAGALKASGRSVCGPAEVEVGELVVEQEAAPRRHDAAAAPVLDGEGLATTLPSPSDTARSVVHRLLRARPGPGRSGADRSSSKG